MQTYIHAHMHTSTHVQHTPVQFASNDDHFIPIAEQLEVAEGLQSELHRWVRINEY